MIELVIDDLRVDEGWVPYVYDDATGLPIVQGSVVEGFPTLGHGFLVDKDRGGYLPKHIGEAWLNYAAMKRWNDLCRRRPFLISLPEHAQRAVANMAYQLGVGGVLTFRNMLASLERFDFHTASREALASQWAVQTPERAHRVANLMRGA